MQINLADILSFFDEKPDWSIGHATGVVAILGEDLAAGALKHCLESNGASNVMVRTETVGTGKQRGPRLDRWIEADLEDGRQVLFQTEIKNFSAHATGGKTLPVSASPDELKAYQNRIWQRRWDSRKRTLKRAHEAKVLVRMKPAFDAGSREQLPLIVFWEPTAPARGFSGGYRVRGAHLFSVPNPTCDFPFIVPATWEGHERGFTELWVFSVSSYLRNAAKTQDSIDLEMPIAEARLGALNRITVSSRSI